jgi:hypothetical protein
VDEQVERLATTLVALGQEEKARKVRDCKKVFAVGNCTNCTASPVYALSCGQRFCPRCMPGRLAADWKDHEGSIPESLTLLRLRPRDLWGINSAGIKKVRNRFNEWRKRTGLAGGIYGIRLEWGRGAVILLALPADDPIPGSSRAFEVEVARERASPDDFLLWLQEEYGDEANGWETDQDLALLLEQTARRRRFQGFGGTYRTSKERSDGGEGEDERAPATPRPLSKVSGGSHTSRKKEVRLCPSCGGRVEMLDFRVPVEEVEFREGCWQWIRSPGEFPSAASGGIR